jgi:branched-subunit amino acid ABC-type transport system permease component
MEILLVACGSVTVGDEAAVGDLGWKGLCYVLQRTRLGLKRRIVEKNEGMKSRCGIRAG